MPVNDRRLSYFLSRGWFLHWTLLWSCMSGPSIFLSLLISCPAVTRRAPAVPLPLNILSCLTHTGLWIRWFFFWSLTAGTGFRAELALLHIELLLSITHRK